MLPLKKYRVKDSNPPWITHGILDMIDKRKEIFGTDQKRTDRWKKMKRLTDRLIKEKKEFIEGLKLKAVNQGNSSLFYKAVKMFKDPELPEQ